MIKLEPINFSDHVRTNDIVNEILLQNPKIKIPIPLEEVAEAAGIIDIQYLKLGALEGALTANPCKTKGVILVNNDPTKGNRQRQRFTLGHELGHFMHPFHKYKMVCSRSDINSSKPSDVIEKQASDFSSQILMPKKQFSQNKYFDCPPSLDNILKLSQLFDVSFEACINRFVELHHEPLMAIFYKDKKFRYFRYKNMPFHFTSRQQKGSLAPFSSLSHKVDMNILNTFYEDYIDSSIWLRPEKGFIFPEEIIEEVYVQKSGYSVTLLKFENEIGEVE